MVDHSTPVSGDVHTFCTRCKADRWHVVVAKVGTRIKRVQCSSCGSPHNLREAGSTTRAPKGETVGRVVRKAGAVKVAPKPWEQLMNDAYGNPEKDYNIKTVFALGDILKHPTFGKGVAVKIADDNRGIEVAFRDGVKLLAMNRG